MKKFALVLALVAGVAHADCHIRSSISVRNAKVTSSPTDVQRFVVTTPKGFKCTTQYRIHIGDNWQTAEGVGEGVTEDSSCAQALDAGRGTLLAEVQPQSIRATNQMVCTDFPDIRVRPVKIGETIWESETDWHSIPAERPYFNYKHTVCRMFIERATQRQDLAIYQGIICKINATQSSMWTVVDKY
jgi:hypothetical protein